MPHRTALAVLAAVVLTALAAYGLGSRGDGDDGLAFRRTPLTYRIVFRVDDLTGGDATVTTEEVLVRRPFEGRRELRAGPPPGGPRLALDVQAFGRQGTQGADEETMVVLAAEPAPAAMDLHPARSLAEAVEHDLIERRGRRTVAGRRCQVFRAGGPVAGGVVTPVGEGDQWADFCVDEAGLVIAEEWTIDGDVVRRRAATLVEEHPSLAGDPFEIDGDAVPVRLGGGAVQRVADDSRPPAADFWELPRALRNFEHRGRYVVSPPSGGSVVGADPGPRQAGVADVWVRGPLVLVIENGGTVGGESAFGAHPHGIPVDLGRLGGGEVVVDLRASEVRVNLPSGRFVRVYGSVAPAELVTVTRSLERGSGGTITTLDEARD